MPENQTQSKKLTLSKSDLRAIIYIGLALVILVGGMAGSYFLLTASPQGLAWAPVILSALPGVVLTVYLPAFRDLTRRIRCIGIALLAVGVVVGFLVLNSALTQVGLLMPTATIGAISLAITVVVALVDWVPQADASPQLSPDLSGMSLAGSSSEVTDKFAVAGGDVRQLRGENNAWAAVHQALAIAVPLAIALTLAFSSGLRSRK